VNVNDMRKVRSRDQGSDWNSLPTTICSHVSFFSDFSQTEFKLLF
jgi:hypothetical protein